jgi:heparosan-N-sulfate-glucuronate 5-epimerase
MIVSGTESGGGTNPRADAGILSSARSFFLPIGQNLQVGGVHGYPIDFSVKAPEARWPPDWALGPPEPLHVDLFQWGLGCYERWLVEGDQAWLDAAVQLGRRAVADQQHGGLLDGGWLHREPFPHTFPLPTPWISAMAQGQGASLLVRLHRETGDDSFAEAAVRALQPLRVPSAEGGAVALLGGRAVLEEYPTARPSFVLNGAIFALWGLHDVGAALGERTAEREFLEGVDTLAGEIHRWDVGHWSRYDLYPHPVVNVASSFYHSLHINQLRAMSTMAPRPQLADAEARFRRYAESRACRSRAFVRKVVFRLVVPRNSILAHRLPWTRLEGE